MKWYRRGYFRYDADIEEAEKNFEEVIAEGDIEWMLENNLPWDVCEDDKRWSFNRAYDRCPIKFRLDFIAWTPYCDPCDD